MYDYDIVVIGGGPAGLTAGIFCARAGLRTIIIERKVLGGRLSEAPLIDNYPGFPKPIRGTELAKLMYEHAISAGVEMAYPEEVVELRIADPYRVVLTREGSKYRSYAVIIATGLAIRKGIIEGEEEFFGRGVSYCAVCDGPLFRGKRIALIGSSYRALNEALFLAELASTLYVVLHEEPESEALPLLKELKQRRQVIVLEGKATRVLGNKGVNALEILYPNGRKEQLSVE